MTQRLPNQVCSLFSALTKMTRAVQNAITTRELTRKITAISLPGGQRSAFGIDTNERQNPAEKSCAARAIRQCRCRDLNEFWIPVKTNSPVEG
jgi:hypothetical protein